MDLSLSSVLALAVLLQAAPGNAPTDALAFLEKVTQRYSHAKSYHIEATTEHTSSNELSRSWQKTFLKAIVAPGGRYRYEGRSGLGSAIIVSNGTARWVYHVDEGQYTEAAASAGDQDRGRIIPEEELPIMEAKQLVGQIRTLSARLKSASFLPDEKVVLDGGTVNCRVVRFTEADFKTRKSDARIEETVWVDKTRDLVVKTFSRSDSYVTIGGSGHIPMMAEDTRLFPVTELDGKEPESSFVFSPPPQAKLVASFPNPFMRGPDARAAEFVGKPAPEIRLKAGGKEIPLSSYRGKPVFVEFWATWCGPCVELIPELKELYAQTASKGLAWVSIDSDEDASSAEKFVKQEGIAWPNYHDDDGTLGKAFGREAIPLGVLIDAEGKVTFYRTGYDISELRAAIAKLGPEFSGFAETPRNPSQTERASEEIIVWKVGSPDRGDTPDTAIPPDLEQAAEQKGLKLTVQAFPAKGFVQQFFEAFRNGQDPDVLAINNYGIIKGITTPLGDFTGIASDEAIHEKLVKVTESMSGLEVDSFGHSKGWEFLVSSSRHFEAAKLLALRHPECDRRWELAPLTQDLEDSVVAIAHAYLEGDKKSLSSWEDEERLHADVGEPRHFNVLEMKGCRYWGDERLTFVPVVSSYELSKALGQVSLLLTLRKQAARWQLLAASTDPISLSRFPEGIPKLMGLLQQGQAPGTAPVPARLLAPADGQFPVPAQGQRFGDFVWQPSTSSNVVAEVIEFAYKDDVRLFLRFALESGQLSAGQLWQTHSLWRWRVWSIADSGAISFSESRTFPN
jgi:thiol-disulfide isomerase/thioredoxin/outer membrane lipoprotein-sorting protein